MEKFILDPWVIVGLAGQLLFFGRFVLQWFQSERRGESVIPVCFWYLSIAGGIILFVYAVHIRDLVFSLGQGLAILIYARNLVLVRRGGVQGSA